MIINGKETVAIELIGKGYWSGSVESHLGFMTKEDYLKYQDGIDSYTPYFHELDGKHSEVEGEVVVHESDEGIANAFTRMTDDWMFGESLMDSVLSDQPLEEYQRVCEFSDEIMNMFSVKTVVTVQIGDKQIVLGE